MKAVRKLDWPKAELLEKISEEGHTDDALLLKSMEAAVDQQPHIATPEAALQANFFRLTGSNVICYTEKDTIAKEIPGNAVAQTSQRYG